MKLWKLIGARSEKGLSQQDMANVIGISKGNYYSKENGIKEFKISEINTILKLLNKTYEEIFK